MQNIRKTSCAVAHPPRLSLYACQPISLRASLFRLDFAKLHCGVSSDLEWHAVAHANLVKPRIGNSGLRHTFRSEGVNPIVNPPVPPEYHAAKALPHARRQPAPQGWYDGCAARFVWSGAHAVFEHRGSSRLWPMRCMRCKHICTTEL